VTELTSVTSALDPHPRSRVKVLETEMSYVDVGQGRPVVFLHGNPTWSFVWRHIIPYVTPHGRCLAPDLIGMGQSGESAAKSYRFVDHVRYLDAWFEALGLTSDVTIVGHDWGGALGFHRAARYPSQIRAIAYMETFVQPRQWQDLRAAGAEFFRRLRSEEGEHLILNENAFVERALPGAILRTLTAEEMAAYRAPYLDRERRWPTLVWPREQPIDGVPPDVVAIVEGYGRWLARSEHPKLFIDASPGSLIGDRAREFCRSWPNQRVVTVKGIHFVQEDSPAEIGEELRKFVRMLGA
jgi:haloalkane dehalogenase